MTDVSRLLFKVCHSKRVRQPVYQQQDHNVPMNKGRKCLISGHFFFKSLTYRTFLCEDNTNTPKKRFII